MVYTSGFIYVGGKKAAKDHAAVWVPDSEAPVCMVCTKTKFSAITRRVWSCLVPFCGVEWVDEFFCVASLSKVWIGSV